jgi:hypothetical protein
VAIRDKSLITRVGELWVRHFLTGLRCRSEDFLK